MNNPKDRFDLYGRKQNWLCISVRKARRRHAGFVCALTVGHVSQQGMAWSLVIAGHWVGEGGGGCDRAWQFVWVGVVRLVSAAWRGHGVMPTAC